MSPTRCAGDWPAAKPLPNLLVKFQLAGGTAGDVLRGHATGSHGDAALLVHEPTEIGQLRQIQPQSPAQPSRLGGHLLMDPIQMTCGNSQDTPGLAQDVVFSGEVFPAGR